MRSKLPWTFSLLNSFKKPICHISKLLGNIFGKMPLNNLVMKCQRLLENIDFNFHIFYYCSQKWIRPITRFTPFCVSGTQLLQIYLGTKIPKWEPELWPELHFFPVFLMIWGESLDQKLPDLVWLCFLICSNIQFWTRGWALLFWKAF